MCQGRRSTSAQSKASTVSVQRRRWLIQYASAQGLHTSKKNIILCVGYCSNYRRIAKTGPWRIAGRSCTTQREMSSGRPLRPKTHATSRMAIPKDRSIVLQLPTS